MQCDLRLTFTDGRNGIWDASVLLWRKETPLTIPLRAPDVFASAFIDSGALAWPNGLELVPWTLHEQMEADGLLAPATA